MLNQHRHKTKTIVEHVCECDRGRTHWRGAALWQKNSWQILLNGFTRTCLLEVVNTFFRRNTRHLHFKHSRLHFLLNGFFPFAADQMLYHLCSSCFSVTSGHALSRYCFLRFRCWSCTVVLIKFEIISSHYINTLGPTKQDLSRALINPLCFVQFFLRKDTVWY